MNPHSSAKCLQMTLKLTIPLGEHIGLGIKKVQIRILPFPTCYLLIWGAFLSILDFWFSVSSEKYNPPHLPGYHENYLKRPMNASTTLLGHTEDFLTCMAIYTLRLGGIDILAMIHLNIWPYDRLRKESSPILLLKKSQRSKLYSAFAPRKFFICVFELNKWWFISSNIYIYIYFCVKFICFIFILMWIVLII